MEQFERIRRENREEGVSIRELARRHQVHRRAVRQALASAVPPPRKLVESRPQPAIGPHAVTIRQWLTDDQEAPRKQRHTARRIWERLVDEHAADVAESTVRRYVRTCRRELHLDHVDVAIVAHHEPGEEAQVDFGLSDVFIAGERTSVAVFELRLSHSGVAVHVAFGSEGQEAFLEGHVTAFSRLGGVPARIRYDNARALVARVLRGRDRIETERFIALRSHYAFASSFCEPGEKGAHEKGGIEGEVGRQCRRFFVPIPKVKSLAELNRRLEEADRRDLARHIGARRQTVGAMGAADRAALAPLPEEPFDAAGSPPSGSTARPGSASASPSTPSRRGSRAGSSAPASAGPGSRLSRAARSSPPTSAASCGAARPWSSTTISRSSSASPERCPVRSRPARPGSGACSRRPTRRSGRGPAAGSATPAGRGP